MPLPTIITKWFDELAYSKCLITVLLLGSVAGIISSCALTAPASEAIIFRDQKEKETEQSPPFLTAGRRFHHLNSIPVFLDLPVPKKLYLTATIRPRIEAELEYAKQNFSAFIQKTLAADSSLTTHNLIIRNAHYFSISAPIPLVKTDEVYWFLNIGYPVLGMDVTTSLSQKTYLTLNVGYLDGEIILQRKVIDSKIFGLAVGGYYRTERRGFEITGDKVSLVPFVLIADLFSADRIFYNHILGGRINTYISLGDNSFLLFRMAPGYTLNLDAVMLNLGLTVRLKF